MNTNKAIYIALITNKRTTDDKYFIKSLNDETLEDFTKRANTCFDSREFYVDIYKGYSTNK